MLWAILAFLGVPLWLIALALLGLFLRNRTLRKRLGDIPVRVRRPGRKRWTRGHAVWVSDVFAWRGSPAAWSEDLAQVHSVSTHVPNGQLRKKLRGLGDEPVIASLSLVGGTYIEVAAGREHRIALLGPFDSAAEQADKGLAR